MKFLVVLIAIIVTTLWKQDLDRINDHWFFKLRGQLERTFAPGKIPESRNWFVVFTGSYSIPLVILALVLWTSGSVLLGFVTLLVHVFVLLMAFDRIQPGVLARQFRQHWEEGDYEACYLYLEQELRCTESPEIDNVEALHTTFKRLYAYRCFERMFVTLFWYLIAGPLGVLFAYLSYQLRYAVPAQSQSPEVEPVEGIIQLLEWLPLRLLGLTLGMVGNFRACFGRFKRVGLTMELNTDQAIYEYILCALGDTGSIVESQAARVVSAREITGDYKAEVAGEIQSIQSLMQRSQFIWLTVFAFVTVMGMQY